MSGRHCYYINDTGNYTDNIGQRLDSVRGEKEDKLLSFSSQLSPQMPAFRTLSTNASTFPSIVPSNSFFSSVDLIFSDPAWLSDNRGNNTFILLLFMEDVGGCSSSDQDLLIPGLADLGAAGELTLMSNTADMLLLGVCLDTLPLSSDEAMWRRFTGLNGLESVSLPRADFTRSRETGGGDLTCSR